MRKRNLPLAWDTNPRQRLNASGGLQLSIKQEEIKERYKRKTGTDLVPERRKMAALRDMFDFQRFSGNEKLCSMIRRAEEHSGSRLSFDDLESVNAAGTPNMLHKKNNDMQ